MAGCQNSVKNHFTAFWGITLLKLGQPEPMTHNGKTTELSTYRDTRSNASDFKLTHSPTHRAEDRPDAALRHPGVKGFQRPERFLGNLGVAVLSQALQRRDRILRAALP